MNIFSIFTCQAHKDRLAALEKTWVPKNMPDECKMYYVYGDAQKAYEDGRNLFLPCHESYEYLLDKTYHTLKYISNIDFDYFIKLDNDVYIPSFPKLIQKIEELKRKDIDFATTWFARESEVSRTWHYTKVPNEFKVPYNGVYPDKWAAGHCYIISKQFCKKALESLEKTKLHLLPVTEAIEDVVISNIMAENKAKSCEIFELVEHLHISIKGLTPDAIIQRHNKQSRQGKSIICACMNREENLRKSLESWLSYGEADEIIIVDWSSNIPFTFSHPKVKIFRVEQESSWCLSMAYNLAASLAQGDVLYKFDADYIIKKGFFERHLPDDSFYCGNYKLARDDNERHLNGCLVVGKKDFDKVNGYNENIRSYGWEDSDLYNRLDKISDRRDIDFDFIHHITHDDCQRSFGKDINKLILENKTIAIQKPWLKTSKKSTYFRIKQREKTVCLRKK